MSSGCKSTWGLAWGSKWSGEFFYFPSIWHQTWAKVGSLLSFSEVFLGHCYREGWPLEVQLHWDSLMRHPSVGWPGLVLGTPGLCSHQIRRSRPLGFAAFNGLEVGSRVLVPRCNPASMCSVSEGLFFLAHSGGHFKRDFLKHCFIGHV